jgi:putative ABC transport system permease protein
MPEWTEHLRPRLASLALSPAREIEIIEELSQHLEERYEELRAAGCGDHEAERLALAELLDPGVLAERMGGLRQAHMPPLIEPGAPRGTRLGDLWQDLRYAVRMLRRQPVFAMAAIVTLALGIGANTAIFALVNAALLRPLPLGDPERLVVLFERTATSGHDGVSPLNLLDWQARGRSFEGMAGFVPFVGGMVMTGSDGLPETVPRQWVTAGFFDVLGVPPIAGRGFQATDDRQRVNVVVLTESFWRTRFGADASVIGRTIRLDGEPYKVVGVFPDAVQVFGHTSIWALRPITGAPPRARNAHVFEGIGRLKPGVTLAAANADLDAVARGLARVVPASNEGRGVSLEPASDAVIGGELRRTSILFLGVVGFVLTICWAHVANLLLARATARSRELAIRIALGASRSRVLRQLVTESLLLALIGCVGGLVLGATILRVAPGMIPEDLLPAAVTLAIDVRVLLFCLGAALLAGLVFGVAPAWQATGLAPAQSLGAGSRTVTNRGGAIRSALVVGEVATAVVLLFGAGLLLRTLLVVEGVDPGYQAHGVLTMIVDPIGGKYPTAASRLQFYDAVERQVGALPGVRNVAWASTLPLGPSQFGKFFFGIVGRPNPADGRRPTADYQIVSPGYFRTVDLAVVAGRPFDPRDTPDSEPVCMVNEAFVRRHLEGRPAIGERVALQPSDSSEKPTVRTIVGVARQVKERPDEADDFLQVYVPLAQDAVDDIFMVVRPESADGNTLARPVRRAIARVDPLTDVRSIMTLERIASDATARHRFRAVLVVAFAGLALLLAMIGLSGILASSTQQRVREFGVRRALGATTADVLRLVLGSAGRVLVIGLAIGLAVSAALGRLVETMLFGVHPMDPATAAAVMVLLSVAVVAAAAGPALRATRVDPVDALRAE